MREIKFRGKRIYTGKWVYGYYFVEALDNEDRDAFSHDHFIKEPYGDHYRDYQIDPETLGEYTGLKDKNGVEIYEGDIFNLLDEYGEIISPANVVDLADFLGGDYWISQHGDEPIYEVIGNIHENPELLK